MRTTVDLVKNILDNTLLSNAVIESYIASANVFVTEALNEVGLSDAILAEIEMWLTAHMIVITRERQSIKEEAGSASITYANVFGAGLKSTTYGQMALMLDSTGTLAVLSGEVKTAYIRAITSFDK